MLVLDERQTNLLMTLKQSMTEESNKKNIDNKTIDVKVENKVTDFKTNDKLHSNIINKDIIMNKINYNTELRKPQRMEIWYVNFGKKNGSIQSGIRPCLTSSNPVNNKYSTIRNVYPITSKLDKATNIPVHVILNENCGLKEKSVVLVEQVTTIDIRYDLMDYVGTVDEITMAKVDMARNIQLGNFQPKNTLERLSSESIQYIVNKIRFIKRAKDTIEFLKTIKGDKFSINLAEDEIFREQNALQSYCEYKNIDYKEVCKNYDEIYGEKYESIAL